MERLCLDLSRLQPPRYVWAHCGRGGLYVMKMIGAPVTKVEAAGR